jgi:uncharacterized lipoprotein YddW (UPF0748 family)
MFLSFCGASFAARDSAVNQKQACLWFDCEANYRRLSSPDSVRHYLQLAKDTGFTDVVLDVKSIMGEVCWHSRIAPFMGEWEGWYRDQDYDLTAIMINECHRIGMRISASLNIFCGGHNFFGRGIIYKQYPQWQSLIYNNGVMTPIEKIKTTYNGMLNPADPEVRRYQLDVLAEFAGRYPHLDGIILDRVRYDGITGDFSDLSRREFERYAGITVGNFPEDILYWEEDSDKMRWRRGPLFKKWVEWRAGVIYTFFEEARRTIRQAAPEVEFGTYTGAWYPTYYEVGVNWASRDYDPSRDYDWATSEYRKWGCAELFDIYMTGLYYTDITTDDGKRRRAAVAKRTEAAMSEAEDDWYTVEGGAKHARELTRGAAPLIGSIYVEQYANHPEEFSLAIRMVMSACDGVMVFDISHIVSRGWWKIVAEAIKNPIK